MRITQASYYTNFLQNVELAQQREMTSEQQVSSGLKVSQPSDDPMAAADIVNLSAESTEATQYTQNVTMAQSSLNTANTALSSVQNIVDQVNSLALSAQSGTSANSSATVAQLSTLNSELLAAANTTNDQGQYIFGGSATNTPPYVQASNGTVSYQGNSTPTVYQVGPGATLQALIPGSQVFNGTVNIFGTISNLMTAIQSGDQAGVTTATQQLQTFSDNTSAASSQVGGLLDMAQSLQSQFSSQGLTIASDLSNVQDANTTTAITNLDEAQNSLEATLQVGAQASQVSLLNYLSTT